MSLDEAIALNDAILEYTYLEGDSEWRADQKDLFLRDEIRTPSYDYPRLIHLLDRFGDQKDLRTLQQDAANAFYALWQATENDELSHAKAELFTNFQQARLRRVQLLLTARDMLEATEAERIATLREKFATLNREIYGEMDEEAWLGIINTEIQRLETYEPGSELASHVQHEALALLEDMPSGVTEQPVLDEALIRTYQPLVALRYAHVLAVVPEVEESYRFTARECRDIMQAALEVGGLTGWRTVIDRNKMVPSTDGSKQTISLPANTRRTPGELQRLILHEQEVHARRAVNARRYPQLPLLQRGTATSADAEEGLGLLLELILSGDPDGPALHRARDRYLTAGLAIGLGDGQARDARDVFEVLWRLLVIRNRPGGVVRRGDITVARDQAYAHIENAFRGTNFSVPGLIYYKLKVYYEGLLKNATHARVIADEPARFEELFIGKYNHTNNVERWQVQAIIHAEWDKELKHKR